MLVAHSIGEQSGARACTCNISHVGSAVHVTCSTTNMISVWAHFTHTISEEKPCQVKMDGILGGRIVCLVKQAASQTSLPVRHAV